MMTNMPPDSHKISLKIIEAIKQHPILYISEVKGPSIKLQEFRQKVWKRISDELGLDPTWVRLRWKNLRDTYCRILKYKNKTDKGMRRKKWIFEDHLSFLKFPYENDYQPQCVELTEEYIQEINAGGISSEGLLEQLEDRNDEDYSEYLEVLEETMADPVVENAQSMETVETIEQIADEILDKTDIEEELKNDGANNYPQQTQSKYRKIRPKRTNEENQTPFNTFSILSNPIKSESINVDSSIISQQFLITRPVLTPFITQTKESNMIKEEKDKIHSDFENKTSVQLFFDSMAQTVKRLPPKAQADLKMSICRIVTEAEVRHSGRKKLQASPKPSKSPNDMPKLVLIPCSMIDNQNHQDAS